MANHLSSLPPCIEKSRTIANIKIHLFHALHLLQRPIQAFFAYLNKPSRQLRRTPSQSSAPASDDSTTVKRNSSHPESLILPFTNLSPIILEGSDSHARTRLRFLQCARAILKVSGVPNRNSVSLPVFQHNCICNLENQSHSKLLEPT